MDSNSSKNLSGLQKELLLLENSPSLEQAKRVILRVISILDKKIDIDDLSQFQLFTDSDGKIKTNSSWFYEDSVLNDRKATYKILAKNDLNIDFKLFGMTKITKSTISWAQALTPNYEDEPFNTKFNVGIDFIVPKNYDRIIIVLSQRWSVRTLELKGNLTATFLKILTNWEKILDFSEKGRVHDILWNSFDLAPINKDFYEGISSRFIQLNQHLVNVKAFNESLASHFTNRLVGRLIFIWFLKEKSILSKDFDYFNSQDFDNDTDYYHEKLEHLFFAVLNTPIDTRDSSDKDTPFLNGGLFEIKPGDLFKDKKLTFPKNYFDEFYSFLRSYNFTTDESSSQFQQVAIDPEMLGRIFENLLAEIKQETGEMARKAKGTFYTPREVVDYMCRESLREYIKSKCKNDEFLDQRISQLLDAPDKDFQDQDQNWRRDWKPYRESFLSALDNLRVLDPACGSGAFPIGMMQLLLKVYERLEPRFDSHKAKLQIIEQNIYGVDIDPMAIEISRLRTWLSIVVDEASNSENIKPLPNLEFKFVCANSLFSLADTGQSSLFDTGINLEQQVESLRDGYFSAKTYNEKLNLKRKYEIILKENSHGLEQSTRRLQLQSFNPFDSESITEFFDPTFIFGVNKFDIVIGNPPYVSYGLRGVGKLEKHEMNRLLAAFPNSAEYKVSMYAMFIERALQLTSDNGVQSFIVPDSFLLGKYYSKIRSYILKEANINEILLLSQNVFGAVVGYSVVYLLVKKPIKGSKVKARMVMDKSLNSFLTHTISQSNFSNNLHKRFQLFFSPEDEKYVSKVESDRVKLGGFVEFKSGLIARNGQKTIVSDEKKNKNWVKGIASGGEVLRYKLQWNGNYIHYKKDLIKSGFGNVDYNSPKLFVRQTGDEIKCALDKDGYVCLNNVHVGNLLPTDLESEVLVAILNSDVIKKYYWLVSLERDRVMAQIDIDVLESIPIPKNISTAIQKKIVGLVNKINNSTDSTEDEVTLNLLIEDLYFSN